VIDDNHRHQNNIIDEYDDGQDYLSIDDRLSTVVAPTNNDATIIMHDDELQIASFQPYACI
jgi:hypothetical protein